METRRKKVGKKTRGELKNKIGQNESDIAWKQIPRDTLGNPVCVTNTYNPIRKDNKEREGREER